VHGLRQCPSGTTQRVLPPHNIFLRFRSNTIKSTFFQLLHSAKMAAPQTSSLVKCLRQDLLYRLRWDLTRPVEEIEIELATDAQDQTVITPFLDHPLADEPLFDLLRLK
jgi:hypothetical protein